MNLPLPMAMLLLDYIGLIGLLAQPLDTIPYLDMNLLLAFISFLCALLLLLVGLAFGYLDISVCLSSSSLLFLLALLSFLPIQHNTIQLDIELE